jgi:hypothetical protein
MGGDEGLFLIVLPDPTRSDADHQQAVEPRQPDYFLPLMPVPASDRHPLREN